MVQALTQFSIRRSHGIFALFLFVFLVISFVVKFELNIARDVSYAISSKSTVALPEFPIEKDINNKPFFWRNAFWIQPVGLWLNHHFDSNSTLLVNEKIHGNDCPGGCNGNGVCNFEDGRCRCRQGYKGPDCTEVDEFPCNLPSSPDLPFGKEIVSICPTTCDARLARCTCGPLSPFPDRPAVEHCGFQRNKDGVVLWGKVDLEALYSNDSASPGWCMANPDSRTNPRRICFCNDDGRTGRLCHVTTLSYCLSGCNNKGVCHSGYCQCEDGWYGVDCSVPSVQKFPLREAPPWLKPEGLVNGNHTARLENFGVQVMKKRPLIYIYDLPLEFTAHHLQGRKWKYFCVPWTYSPSNETEFNYRYLYGTEMALYEALLSSPHRTENGEEADYFFVPVVTACITARAGDSPRISRDSYTYFRPKLVVNFVLRALAHIKSKHPFWNRSNGRDHIWSFPWDEGGCYAPQAIASSIFLSSWGNTMLKHNKTTSTYWEDDWSRILKAYRGNHTCFDPQKDIVVPAWKSPPFFADNLKSMKRMYDDRHLLFYFNGNLGHRYHLGRPEQRYSMGIRQKVAALFSSVRNKEGKLGTHSERGVVVTNERAEDYGGQLSSSRFCGVFPGDGFSSRMEDSILHGCIPVIVQDGIQLPWENVLHYDSFSVRINEDDIPNMIQILKNISREEVVSKLENVQKVWQRWTYHSVSKLEAKRQEKLHGHIRHWALQMSQLNGDDAIDTLMQTLFYKLYNDEWRKLAV